MYMNDIKLFVRNEKEFETLRHAVRIYSQDLGMEFGIEKLCYAYHERGEMKKDRRNIATKLDKKLNVWRKGNP